MVGQFEASQPLSEAINWQVAQGQLELDSPIIPTTSEPFFLPQHLHPVLKVYTSASNYPVKHTSGIGLDGTLVLQLIDRLGQRTDDLPTLDLFDLVSLLHNTLMEGLR